ncbi:hypothetical protein FA10DRAFT_269808 [Acaromyces ingoldii]|uniref:TNFR-Cys domain-containing protein n=1 Tax=Acaromyces ingoldii TaxID=215250 RepID=A0A316YDL1_9BASI|nr:hypothetical protein FA10DRAFT_269808 [Acaromyces ingoldii]PWN87221.1 hypothetical protein FA10DRAFT_269808 [Acaromyces ingoldii]
MRCSLLLIAVALCLLASLVQAEGCFYDDQVCCKCAPKSGSTKSVYSCADNSTCPLGCTEADDDKCHGSPQSDSLSRKTDTTASHKKHTKHKHGEEKPDAHKHKGQSQQKKPGQGEPPVTSHLNGGKAKKPLDGKAKGPLDGLFP